VAGWNWPVSGADYGSMRDLRCDDVWLSLSARLDGEVMSLPTEVVDGHVESCPTCHAWLAGAERVTRLVRVQPVEVPDLTARILASLQADGTVAGRVAARTRTAAARTSRADPGVRADWISRLRWGLGLLAFVQLMIAVPGMLGAAGHDAHAGREVAAFQIAVSVGLLVAAFYPEYARVFAPVAIALVVCFATISTLDMIEGAVTPTRVAVHILTVAQAVFVWQLARGSNRRPVTA
jgi:predicted anti-sigma-YlaC factor YlaD